MTSSQVIATYFFFIVSLLFYPSAALTKCLKKIEKKKYFYRSHEQKCTIPRLCLFFSGESPATRPFNYILISVVYLVANNILLYKNHVCGEICFTYKWNFTAKSWITSTLSKTYWHVLLKTRCGRNSYIILQLFSEFCWFYFLISEDYYHFKVLCH